MGNISGQDELVTKKDLADFYKALLPYLGSGNAIPEILANKFSKDNIYSSDEKMIGQWIDGKPIYQKTITTAAPVVTTDGVAEKRNIDISSLELEKVISTRIVFIADLLKVGYDGPWLSDSGKHLRAYVYNLPSVSLILSSSLSSYNNKTVYITIQYTKTTDSLISIGIDTDYSTNEKIIGTWIDGKPIYQKTIETTFSSTENLKYIPIGSEIEWATFEIQVYHVNGDVIHTLNTVKPNNTTDIGWSLRAAVIPNTATNNKNTIMLENINGSSYAGVTTYITIRYTKTTD